MSESGKILLVENQYSQFRIIRKYLSTEGFIVYPDEDKQSFREYLNLIRVYLNPRYGGTEPGSRRSRVFKEIMDNLLKIKPDIIIIDYILVGNHIAENGIDLAKKLRENNITVPILFLSRESIRKRHILKKLKNNNLFPYEWLHKGFSGEDILEPEYFKSNVISIIPKMIRKNEYDILKEKVKNFSTTFTYPKAGLTPTEKRKIEKYNDSISYLKGFINDVKYSSDNYNDLMQIYDNLKSIIIYGDGIEKIKYPVHKNNYDNIFKLFENDIIPRILKLKNQSEFH